MLHTHSLPTPFLLHDSLKGMSSQPHPSGRQGSGSWLVMGVSCSSMFLLYCGRRERSSLLPSDQFRRHQILGLISWRTDSVRTFGPRSELCVCPLPSVGDDTGFIILVSHGIATYWEKSDYDLLLTEHPILKVILPLLSLLSCSYHHKKKPTTSQQQQQNNPGVKSCFTKVLRAVGVTVVFPENLWPSQGKLVHVRILW